MGVPYMGIPSMGNPYMGVPHMGNPYMGDPYMGDPYMGYPYMGNPYCTTAVAMALFSFLFRESKAGFMRCCGLCLSLTAIQGKMDSLNLKSSHKRGASPGHVVSTVQSVH